MGKTLRDIIASLALATTLLLQQGMIPVVDTKPAASGPVGLLDEWPMNEGSGTTFFDTVSSNPSNALFQTGSGITFGAVGGWPATPATFSLGNGAGATPASPKFITLDGTTPLSVCSWVKAPSWPGAASAAMSTRSGPFFHTGFELDFSSTGQITAFLANNLTTNGLEVIQTSGNTAGSNLQACWTYNGSRTPAGITIYANGSSVATTTVVNTLSATISNPAIGLGVVFNGGGGAAPFNGTVGYVSIWNCVLSAGVISTNNAAGPSFTGLHC